MLLVAGLAKLENSRDFASVVSVLGWIPVRLIKPFTVIFAWFEIVFAFVLASGLWLIGGATMTVMLFFVFLIARIFIARREHNVNCGCFGTRQRAKTNSVELTVSGTHLALAMFYLWLTTWVKPLPIIFNAIVMILFVVFCLMVGWRLMQQKSHIVSKSS
jgi:hypothetical protein